ncbi:hypothetical protein QTG54_009808 [Skeletonema marinoi]|uniref:Uncharacterized protein n=1 Tax=Skeletonema marinoi TaxID=267567 RepID=A0AAD8Y603_9STRA|nr:hypothetical protein QTG54_009808 [Skeletonema marinoi]
MVRRFTWPFRRSRRQEIIEEDEPCIDDEASHVFQLGRLIQEQGRCLDELTNRSNSLATENIVLRERISSGIDRVSKSSRRREPLSSIINTKKRMQGDDMLQKFKDENEMLLQQADLLAKELNDAHSSIAERDSSITSMSHELSGLLEKARTLTVEKKSWKADMLDKAAEIESLQTHEKQSNSLRSELSARVEELQSEVESTRAEAEMLVSCTTRSASEMEGLRTTLRLKQDEVERLDGERRGMERELCSVRRDAKASKEAANRLRELNSQHELQRNELQQKVKDLSEELCKSDLKHHKLQTKSDFLEKEMDAMANSHRKDVASITSNFSKIKEQHAAEIQAKETVIDKLRRRISQLEIDNSTNQREKQSLDQRCHSLTSLLDAIQKDHQSSFQETLYRATDAENQLERKLNEVKDLKTTAVQLETSLQTTQADAVDKEARLIKVQTSLQEELKTKTIEMDALSTQVDRLREESKQMQQGHEKVVDDLQQDTENQIRSAEMEVEKLRALSKGHKLDAKRSEDLNEKQSLMYQVLLDEMAAEKKDQKDQMETVIRSERDVSTRLMTKTQELNSTISKLSADHFLSKEAQYTQMNKIKKLEQTVACGEAKLRTMAGNYCKLSDVHELLIGKESETKRRLHETKIELEKMKAATATQHM